MSIKSEWDSRKARQNLRKHGIIFDEATTVFADILSVTIPDPDHSEDDERWVTMGLSNRHRLLVVVHLKKRKRSGSLVSEQQSALSGGNMKKGTRRNDKIRNHYDFTGGVRGKYSHRYAEGTNVVVLDPDVARLFPNRQAVNETLPAVAQIVADTGAKAGRH